MMEDYEITTQMYSILLGYLSHEKADAVMYGLNQLDENDFTKFTQLIHQWNNCRWNESR